MGELVALYLLVGFVHSALMSRWYEQQTDAEILQNILLWALLIPARFSLLIWRLMAGYTPSYYKNSYYIWSRW